MEKFDYKKSLGQNFLKDNNIINKIVEAVDATKDDLIIEIGPGAGALTKNLVNKKADVICFEIDKRLEEKLNKINSSNLKIYYEDFLKVNLSEYIDYSKYKKIYFVGNLPYYITTAILNKIIDEKCNPTIVIMVQKEVAERFCAKPNNKKYNSLSVFLQYNFDIQKVCEVSKNCFEPIPKVDSAVVKFIANKKYIVDDEKYFYKLVKESFVQKRKNLRNNLKNYDENKINEILFKFGKDVKCRAENLSVEEFIILANELKKIIN